MHTAYENVKFVTHKFDEAVKKDDLASVERFLKNFPLLGRHNEGIEGEYPSRITCRFFVRQIVHTNFENRFRSYTFQDSLLLRNNTV